LEILSLPRLFLRKFSMNLCRLLLCGSVVKWFGDRIAWFLDCSLTKSGAFCYQTKVLHQFCWILHLILLWQREVELHPQSIQELWEMPSSRNSDQCQAWLAKQWWIFRVEVRRGVLFASLM
jgi:hypothetical protein